MPWPGGAAILTHQHTAHNKWTGPAFVGRRRGNACWQSPCSGAFEVCVAKPQRGLCAGGGLGATSLSFFVSVFLLWFLEFLREQERWRRRHLLGGVATAAAAAAAAAAAPPPHVVANQHLQPAGGFARTSGSHSRSSSSSCLARARLCCFSTCFLRQQQAAAAAAFLLSFFGRFLCVGP